MKRCTCSRTNKYRWTWIQKFFCYSKRTSVGDHLQYRRYS